MLSNYSSWGWLLLITSLVLFNGCALTSPTSERIIFEKENEKSTDPGSLFPKSPHPEKERISTSFFNQGILLYYMKTTFRPRIEEELNYAKDKFSSFINREFAEHERLTNADLSIRNPYYLSLAVPAPMIKSENFFWSLNFGFPVLSTDATVHLGSDIYATANFGIVDGEFILQKKVLHNKSIGLAVGGFYRAERRGFEIEGNELGPSIVLEPLLDGLLADRIFYNQIVGGRINGYISRGDNAFAHVRVAPGYAFNLKALLVNFSVTIQISTK